MYASFYSHRKDLIINPVRQQRSCSYTESTFLTAAEHLFCQFYIYYFYIVFAGSMWIMEKMEEEKVEKVIDDVMRETT